MGNIVGEGFNKKIIEQIKQRQKVYGSLNRDNDQLTYLNSRTGWCKLISGASVDAEVLDVRKLNGLSSGDDLAKNYVLFGGMRGGPNTSRQGVAQINEIGSPNVYGFGGTEFGLRPMPGIISAEIQTETRGSIKRATVKIQANNKAQFDVIDILYMRLGYSMLLEWGNSSYFDNDGTYEKNNPYSLETEFLNGYYNTVNDTTEDLTYDNILSVIEDFRLKSHGNYDALFCKVVNFSWSFTKDGKYDITLKLISLGDVIESLKANVLYKGDNTINILNFGATGSSSNGTPSNPIVTFQNAHEIGKKFYEIYTELDPYTGGYTGMAHAGYLPDTSNTGYTTGQSLPYYKQVFQNTEPIYYIRLGYFLEWINKNLLYNVNNKPNQKILKIDTNVKTNIIHLIENQVSSNLNICVFKTVYSYPLGPSAKTYFAYPYGDNFVHAYSATPNQYSYPTDNRYGYLMNAYFSLEYILNEIENKKDKNGKTSIYDLLTSLCDGFNQSTGNYNKLEVTIDSETNTARFTDSVELPDRDLILNQLNDPEISTEEALFDTYRYVDAEINNETVSSAGFIRDLSFTTTVSPDLATMITVGSTNHGYVVGEEATALSRMNLGITDRYKESINEPDTNVNYEDTLEVKYKTALNDFDQYVAYIGYTQYSSTNSKPSLLNTSDLGNFSQTQTQLYEYQQAYNTYKASQVDPTAASPNAGFLPFNLSLTMDGLSGMKVYQRFTIESDFLPTNYPRTLEFLIKGIKHKIENNQWITEIDSMCIAKDPFGTLSTNSTTTTQSTITTLSTTTPAPTTTSPTPTNNNIITPTNIPPPASNTPLLTKAVTDQSQYVFNSRGEALGLCANYTFNIAYKVKEHIDTRSNQAIPFSGGIGRGTANIPSGGNANTNSHRQAINRLGLYDEYYIGEYTPSQLKQWASSQTFNYGDILNYYAPGQSGPHNMHSQIYTGTLFRSGKSRSGTAGNSGWTTSVKTNYGGTVIYNNNNPFKVYYYQVKPTYQV
jgi:hypothetical protein